MAGIDGITGDILAAARQEAGEIIKIAEQEASQVKEKAEADAKQLFDGIIEAARAKAQAEHDRAASQASLNRRQTLLAAKQQIIGKIIEDAKASLAEQDDSAYFDMTAKLIRKAAWPQDGTIVFGKNDLKRITPEFEALILDAAKQAGGTLKISSEPADIKDGFILKYGGIEENCTLDAIFASMADTLTDKVNGTLW